MCSVASLALVASIATPELCAQQEERPEVMKALELESAGKYRDAVVILRAAVHTAPSPTAVLALERVYAELGMSDSLLAPIDTLIRLSPREPLYRSIQLRTLQTLRRDDQLREAFERWVRASPRDPAPYREYARILIQLGRPASGDTIIMRGKNALGTLRDLEYENAQLRAALGEWVPSAQAWRRALSEAPYLATAAAFALAPAPASARENIRDVFLSFPVELGARRALAELLLSWGAPTAAWESLRSLRPDTASATVWSEFAERAYADERWALARDAYAAALGVRRLPHLAVRASAAALKAGTPNDVFSLAPLGEMGTDSASAGRQYVPLHVDALVAIGRTQDAEALIAKYDQYFSPVQRMRATQSVAMGWVREGDLQKARAALTAAGPDADSSDAAGLLALYEGRLDAARLLLRSGAAPGADLTPALGIISRLRTDRAPTVGAAFLALARGDSAGASGKFVEAATAEPSVAPALLLMAARLKGARGDAAIPIWQKIVADFPGTPEAAESELEWARALRRRGDLASATARFEHLILSAPQSALLPQARRELEQLRGTVPPSS